MIFALGAGLHLASIPNMEARAQQDCFFGPPDPQGSGISLGAIALFSFVGGCIVLAPCILRARMIQEDDMADPERARDLLERQDRRWASTAARTANPAR